MSSNNQTATQQQAAKKPKKNKKGTGWLIFIIVLCVLLLPIIIFNVTFIIKSSTSDGLPDIFGYTPLTVTSGSMDGDQEDSFPAGSLIIVKILSEEDKQQLTEGDIITFVSEGNYVTHRIIEITTSEGQVTAFTTKGDANNIDDGLIPIENVQGLVVNSISGLGSFVLFLQQPYGVLIIIGVPVLLVVGFYIFRITRSDKRKNEAQTAQSEVISEQEEEIRRLKEELAAKNKDDK